MAEEVELSVSVEYSGKKKIFSFPKHYEVRKALRAIGDYYKQPPASICLLYMGVEIAEGTVLKDVFPSDRIATAHVLSRDGVTAPRQGKTVIDLTKRYYGYCKTCKACVIARPVYYHCRDQDGKFRLKRPEAVDFHQDIIPPDHLAGECLVCHEVDTKARATFVCAEEGSGVAFLKSVRWNSSCRVTCMMCSEIKDIVFVFMCKSKHSLCLECFAQYCKVMLGSDKFSSFECGYSVCCPGPDESCVCSPVEDPHHFQMVDKDGTFYKKFIEFAANPAHIASKGNDVMCTQCLKEINLSSDENNVEQVPPSAPVPGRMFSFTRLFTRQVTAPVSTRSKVTCPSCKATYCLSCKKAWHEGKCPDPTQQEQLYTRFKITPAMAAKSRWTGN